jgi:hypothetical protein
MLWCESIVLLNFCSLNNQRSRVGFYLMRALNVGVSATNLRTSKE